MFATCRRGDGATRAPRRQTEAITHVGFHRLSRRRLAHQQPTPSARSTSCKHGKASDRQPRCGTRLLPNTRPGWASLPFDGKANPSEMLSCTTCGVHTSKLSRS